MTTEYNQYLVILSVAVAILASYVALNLAYSITQAKGYAKSLWLAGGSLAMGTGIWSMHFIGMLAFEMHDLEVGYDIPLMIFSIVVAVMGSALALYIVSRPTISLRSIYIGGFFMAIAICGMHYIGMYSMRMSTSLEWNYGLVFLSFVIALIASLAALWISSKLRHQPHKISLLALASLIMGAAISGMHYTGMSAATFVHDHTLQVNDSDLLVSNNLMVTTIIATVSILALALVVSISQRLLSYSAKENKLQIDSVEEKFRILVEAVKDYAIFILDPDGHITTWNKGAENILGYTYEEIIGKHFSTLYSEEEVKFATPEKELATVKQTGHFEGEVLRRRKDGTTFWAKIILDSLVDRNGKLKGFSNVVRDITEDKEAERKNRSLNEELEKRVQERTKALQMREAQLHNISNAIPILVAQFNTREEVLFANNTFSEWFQCPSNEIVGKTFRELLGEDRYPGNKIFIDRVLIGESVTYERNSQSGSKKAILSITFVPDLNEMNEVEGFIIVATDVSSYKKIEIELKNAKEDAEVANETKSAFLANMSHEIRTPLGAVIGFSELLAESNMSESEKMSTIEIIKRNGQLLSTIINDILDLSKVEAGKMEIERIPVFLMEIVNEIALLLNLEASGKGIQLKVSTDGDVPNMIYTDPSRLRQILFNIVGNAVKFTNKGSVDLNLKIDEKDCGKIEFTVTDTGTGITQSQASRLFSPFTQADVTTTRKFGGTGLGLVLSKKLAAALGGDVKLIQSQIGKGSTFVITIEHGLSKEILKGGKFESKDITARGLNSNLNAPESVLAGQKILIVDDSPDNLALIKWILKLTGAEVFTAQNGREGIEKALNHDVNVILMDLQMPEMDGYEATRILRKQGFTNPIVALTAHAMKEERKRCLENGFNEHITKPVDKTRLIHTLYEIKQH